MTGIYDLAEKGRRIRKEEEERERAAQEKAAVTKRRVSFLSGYKRSTWAGVALYTGILCVAASILLPLLDSGAVFPGRLHYLLLATGLLVTAISGLIVRYHMNTSKAWERSLPFRLPAYYQSFLNTQFSQYSRGAGTFYNTVTMEIVFGDPFDAELVTNAVAGLGQKGITMETSAETMEQELEELENPVAEGEPPEEDREYFSTQQEKDSGAVSARDESRVLTITGDHFVNGNEFHRFVRRLCSGILVSLHREHRIRSIRFTNDGDPDFC